MFLWVEPGVFSFWNLKTQSLLRRESSLVALVQRGSIVDDSRLDLWFFNPDFSIAFPWKPFWNLNACLVTTFFNSKKLPQTLSNILQCFLPTKYLETLDFMLESSFLFTLQLTLFFYTIFTPKAWFLSWIFSLISFSYFL